jgi:formylglycine-generating enzyme required for sulfatase activity
MPSKVFISYRRDDSAGHAGRVHDRLEREFGAGLLFMDVDAIPLGANFIKVLRDEVAKCDVLLALIGPNWLNVRDEEGNRRLDNPRDFLRIEIAAALQRDIPVIPILLDGARMPNASQLPRDLKELSARNGLDIRHASFHSDMDKLIRGLKGRQTTTRRAVSRVLKGEPRSTASQKAVPAREGRNRAGASDRSAAAQSRTKGPSGRSAAARKATRTRALPSDPTPPASSQEDRMRAEGRVLVDVAIARNANGKWFLPRAGKTEWFKDHEAGPEMVVVPAGNFEMGSPDDEPERESWQVGTESPQHEVAIAQPFAVARHPITRGQFAAFVSDTGHELRGRAYVWKGGQWVHDPKASWRVPGLLQNDSHPVVCINWDDAKAYAAWLARTTGKSYRLLSEAEREYVARAGTTTPFWWGSSITPAQANYDGRFVYKGGGSKGEWRESTVPVGTFEANPWGLYNVHGNVWDLCDDVWHDNYSDAPVDGSAWLQGGDASRRVARGGSWINFPQNLRAAYRYGFTIVDRYGDVGFRLARTLNPG